MFISSVWDGEEPAHHSESVGHEVPSVVAVFVTVWVGLGRVIYLVGDLVFYCELPASGQICK